MAITQCHEAGCAFIHFESSIQDHEMTIPMIVTQQNGREYYSSTIDVNDILRFADIPALNFSLNNNEFCEYTQNKAIAIIAAGGEPTRWQRVTNPGRIGGIGAWIAGPGNHTMPDGILLGEKLEDLVHINANNATLVGGRTIYPGDLSNTLIDGCPLCGNFGQDAGGNQIYRNRCFNHGCNHHETSTSPLAIIDGQHRTMGLFESAAGGSKDVSCSILLQNPANGIGYGLLEQARVFTQVNTESKDLEKLHKLWLKRVFTDWAPPGYVSNAKTAYDLLIRLGFRGVASPWNAALGANGLMMAHPNPGSRRRLNARQGSDAGSAGKILGESGMEGNIDILNADLGGYGIAIDTMMDNWLRSSVANLGAMFAYPAAASVFDNERCFEAWLRVYPKIRDLVVADPAFTGTFTAADYDIAISLHAGEFAAANLGEWERFNSAAEPPKKHLYNILRMMWTPVAGIILPAPNWPTHLMPGGAAPASWVEYLGLAPDPIADFSIVSNLVSGYQPAGTTLDPANARAVWGGNGDVAAWSRPVNTGRAATIHYRYETAGVMGQWRKWERSGGTEANNPVCHVDNSCEIECGPDSFGHIVALGPGHNWDLRISYTGQPIGNPTTEIVVGFVTP